MATSESTFMLPTQVVVADNTEDPFSLVSEKILTLLEAL